MPAATLPDETRPSELPLPNHDVATAHRRASAPAGRRSRALCVGARWTGHARAVADGGRSLVCEFGGFGPKGTVDNTVGPRPRGNVILEGRRANPVGMTASRTPDKVIFKYSFSIDASISGRILCLNASSVWAPGRGPSPEAGGLPPSLVFNFERAQDARRRAGKSKAAFYPNPTQTDANPPKNGITSSLERRLQVAHASGRASAGAAGGVR